MGSITLCSIMYLFLIKVKHTYLTLDEGPVGWEARICLFGVYRVWFSKKRATEGHKGQQDILLCLGVPISLHVSRQRRAQEGEIFEVMTSTTIT